MQTFLPYPYFAESMRVLDDSRLGNQVYREGMTLLRGGWPNHPASKMWQGYEPALARYLMTGVNELIYRGKDYTDRPWCQELMGYLTIGPDPDWLGDPDFHASHRSNLLRKGCEDVIFSELAGIDEWPSKKQDWTPELFELAYDEYGKPDVTHYTKFGWTEPDNLPYVWPV